MKLTDKRNKFRRQFVLARRELKADWLDGWTHNNIHDEWHLYMHPDLRGIAYRRCDEFVIQLGTTFHTTRIQSSDATVSLIQSSTIDELFERAKYFCGRFVIIAYIDEKFIIFNDAGAARQVFYSDGVIGSQPKIIKEFIDVTRDVEYVNYNGRTRDDIPLISTCYVEVKRLLPSHYLDINNLSTHRYWPNEKWEPISNDEGRDRLFKYFETVMKNAYEQYDLMCGMSSGIDSRLILAATRDNAIYVTATNQYVNERHPDATVPPVVTRKFGFRHELFKYKDGMLVDIDDEFWLAFSSCVTSPRLQNSMFPYVMWKHYDVIKDMVFVSGNYSEFVKGFYSYRQNRSNAGLDYTGLLLISHFNNDAFLREELRDWGIDVMNIEREYLGIEAVDLAYLEIGNTIPVAGTESDIVFDTFSPFNSHYWAETVFAIDRNYRYGRNCALYIDLMEKMLPGASKIPFTPKSFNARDYE